MDDGADAARWVDDALWFLRHHQAPAGGGMLDQDPRFVETVGIVDAVQLETLKVK